MNNSTDYHQPVLEALSAFVRMGTETATGKGPPANDIQAALTVMGRCISGFNERNLNLAKAHIPKADLSNAHLSSAHLGDADLDSALLPRDGAAFEKCLTDSVAEAVRLQAEAGIDV